MTKIIIAQIFLLILFYYLAMNSSGNTEPSEFSKTFSLNPTNIPKQPPQQNSSTPKTPPKEWIFRTNNLTTTLNTTCPQKNQKISMLCKLGVSSSCRGENLSEALSTFWIICPIYTANQGATQLLYQLHRNFRSYIESYGINFQTVEVIFPGQEFQLTRANNQPYDLQYRDEWIFAMRENLVNVGIKHLPDDWEYMSWVDQHIFWEDPYWFEKCIWLFSHHNIVHMLNGNHFYKLKNTTDYSLEG